MTTQEDTMYTGTMARRNRRQYDTDRNLAAWLADEAHPENREAYDYLVELEQTDRLDSFTGDILRKTRRWGPMSDRQRDAVLRSKTRHAEFQARCEAEAAALADVAPLAEGRRTIAGEVVSCKMKMTPYGDTLKMLVREADGNKVWGTVPANIADDCWQFAGDPTEELKGRQIELVAEVKRSVSDPHFGFYSRPKNGRLL